MKDIKQTIIINRPVEEVFSFVINPANTLKWVETITTEQTNEWPVKVGTIYRSQNQAGDWAELTLMTIEPDKSFTMAKSDGSFFVNYVFNAATPQSTRLDYTWGSEGEPDALFLDKILNKLKSVIEN